MPASQTDLFHDTQLFLNFRYMLCFIFRPSNFAISCQGWKNLRGKQPLIYYSQIPSILTHPRGPTCQPTAAPQKHLHPEMKPFNSCFSYWCYINMGSRGVDARDHTATRLTYSREVKSTQLEMFLFSCLEAARDYQQVKQRCCIEPLDLFRPFT